MEFSVVAGLVAGLIGTAVMTMMMKMAGAAGMTQMPPMELISGSMLTGDETKAKQLGVVVHWIMMGTVVFGLGYALIFSIAGQAGWLLGLGVGVAHGIVVGMVMAMMPVMHPRMSGPAAAGGPVTVDAAGVHLSAPGPFGVAWGGMTPVGMIMGHAVYGVVVALVYQALT
ncbi:MAG: hypothetical protein WD250_01385 [Egibacteraceae bacterium]